MSKLTDKEADTKDTNKDDLVSMISMAMEKPEMRVMAIYGDINEERCMEAVYALLTLDDTARSLTLSDVEDPQSEKVELTEPISLYISSHGGQATEMFAVYDVMRVIRERTPIHTVGIGKVMSAGVLLLAAGTKGERRIGKNCRVMLHGVQSGQHGNLSDLENEMAEAKWTQDTLVNCLTKETKMTKKYLKKILAKRMNIYFIAEEAVELGIADEIV